jgi:hypothetical protein
VIALISRRDARAEVALREALEHPGGAAPNVGERVRIPEPPVHLGGLERGQRLVLGLLVVGSENLGCLPSDATEDDLHILILQRWEGHEASGAVLVELNASWTQRQPLKGGGQWEQEDEEDQSGGRREDALGKPVTKGYLRLALEEGHARREGNKDRRSSVGAPTTTP